MDRGQIKNALDRLNTELDRIGIKGELCLYGGAAMCLAFDARPSARDIDAVFKPTQQTREAIARVAKSEGLREDWVNDAVKGFVVHPQRILFDLSHLKVFVPEPDYLLAMKALAARVEGTDRGDVEFLIQRLGIRSPQEVFSVLEKYYPRGQIKPATRYFVEDLFQQ